MKAVKSNVTRGINLGCEMETCDNSGAKVVKVVTVCGLKTVKGKTPAAGVSDLVMVAVKKGKKDVRKTVMFAVIVRQKKEYKRPDGRRLKFEDNSLVILKDEKGNPKGTMIKGPVAKEVVERWPAIAKIAKIVI